LEKDERMGSNGVDGDVGREEGMGEGEK